MYIYVQDSSQRLVCIAADFEKLSREMINALRAPIELEGMGANELEVRLLVYHLTKVSCIIWFS